MTVVACGIDPGRDWALAVVEYPGDRLHATDFALPGQNSLREALETLGKWGRLEHPIAIEDQFLGKSARTTIGLAHRAGEWAGMARLLGWPKAIYVKPQTWRAPYQRGRRSKGRGRWAKSDAIRWATLLFQMTLQPEDHNLAEALLIARWAAVQRYQELQG